MLEPTRPDDDQLDELRLRTSCLRLVLDRIIDDVACAVTSAVGLNDLARIAVSGTEAGEDWASRLAALDLDEVLQVDECLVVIHRLVDEALGR